MNQTSYVTPSSVADIVCKTHITDLEIKSSDKLILIALCTHIHANTSDGYYCNPSHSLLEKETGFKARTISQSIGVLQESGYLKSQASKYSNNYFINVGLIVGKHNLWCQSYNKSSLNPSYIVPECASIGYERVEVKRQDHTRNTLGFVQNQIKVYCNDLGEYDSPFGGLTSEDASCYAKYSVNVNVVYFFYGSAHELLYVGRTNNFVKRWSDHCNSGKPMHLVKFVGVHVFDTKPEVVFYEAQKILQLEPEWNISGTNGKISHYEMQPKCVDDFLCSIKSS